MNLVYRYNSKIIRCNADPCSRQIAKADYVFIKYTGNKGPMYYLYIDRQNLVSGLVFTPKQMDFAIPQFIQHKRLVLITDISKYKKHQRIMLKNEIIRALEKEGYKI